MIYNFNFLTLFMVLILFQSPLIAKTEQKKSTTVEVPSTETPSFSVSEGISEKIYQQTIKQSSYSQSDPLRVDTSFRVFFPSLFELKNKYFDVPYSDNAASFPGISIRPQTRLTSIYGGKLLGFGSIGYTYSQGIYNAQSESGLDIKDGIELQWIPIQAGFEVVSRFFTRQNISFSAFTSSGVDWYTQSGQLDGMNQNFWVPRYEGGASLTVFSSAQSNGGGFDGIRLSGLMYRSFLSDQSNRGWATDVGARYAF